MAGERLTEKQRHDLAELALLETGWNGYNAPPIDNNCLARVIPFVELLNDLNMAPCLTAGNSGGVIIQRFGPDDYSVEIERDGRVALYFDELNDMGALSILMEAAAHLPPPKNLAAIKAHLAKTTSHDH